MNDQRDNDDVLLAGVMAGDSAAFDAWFRRDHPVVWRFAYGIVGHRSEADDLAQDAMLQLHDKLETRDPSHSYGAWRDALVLNLCRDRLRRRATRLRAETGAGEERATRSVQASSAELERADLQAVLARALEQLSERERAAFVLRELEGRTTLHVAAVLEIGESSVRSLLTLARRRLRAVLGERFDPRPAAAREASDG